MTDTTTDTICALATPPGVAGLAVVRVSGPRAFVLCDSFFHGSASATEAADHSITFGWWDDGDRHIDTVTLMVYRAPRSYTGEDVVEIGCHGGVFISDQIISGLLNVGARLADPGEFTRRAFINRKLDLVQVEAVADMIHAATQQGAQTAARQLAGGFTKRLESFRNALLEILGLLELELDFSDEDVEFVPRSLLRERLGAILQDVSLTASTAREASLLRSGFHVAVVGFPNAGKSSLFNALLLRNRAIVSDLPGTTRDYISETILLDGYAVHLIDTAGIRSTEDTIELEGIAITVSLVEQADLVLVLNDITLGQDHSDSLAVDLAARYPATPVFVVQNKIDCIESATNPAGQLCCSAATGAGLDELRQFIVSAIRSRTSGISDVLVNDRQARLLVGIAEGLSSVIAGLDGKASSDVLAVDLRMCVRIMGEITGETWNPDVLDTVFSRFCIGK